MEARGSGRSSGLHRSAVPLPYASSSRIPERNRRNRGAGSGPIEAPVPGARGEAVRGSERKNRVRLLSGLPDNRFAGFAKVVSRSAGSSRIALADSDRSPSMSRPSTPPSPQIVPGRLRFVRRFRGPERGRECRRTRYLLYLMTFAEKRPAQGAFDRRFRQRGPGGTAVRLKNRRRMVR